MAMSLELFTIAMLVIVCFGAFRNALVPVFCLEYFQSGFCFSLALSLLLFSPPTISLPQVVLSSDEYVFGVLCLVAIALFG